MTNIIPPTNTIGVWKAKAPFSVKASMPYCLIAIRMFEDITKLGVDVYTTYYEPFIKDGDQIPGTSDTFSFKNEIDKGARILTIKSEAGEVLYIPSTFIAEFPDTDIVLYRPMIVSINLGLFKEEMDYSILLQDLEETCMANTGVDAVQTAIHAAPATEGLTTEEVAILETARQNKMANTETNIERIVRLEAENAQLRDTNAKALEVLRNNGLIN
jgi:hypothetical protein